MIVAHSFIIGICVFFRRIQILSIFGLVLMCQVAVVSAQELHVGLKLLQDNFVVNEPVIIRVVVTNTGSGTVQVAKDISAESANTSYYVSHGGDNWVKIVWPFVDEPSGENVKLFPGDSFSYDQMLYWKSSTSTVFSESAEWKIKANFHQLVVNEDLAADPISIIINDPVEAEIQPSELFGDPNVIRFVMDMDESPDAISTLRELAFSENESQFKEYSLYFLARRQNTDYFDRKSDPTKAVQYLKKLLSNSLQTFQIESAAIDELARSYEHIGSTLNALELYNKLLEEYPESPAAVRAKKRSEILLEKINKVSKSPVIMESDALGSVESDSNEDIILPIVAQEDIQKKVWAEIEALKQMDNAYNADQITLIDIPKEKKTRRMSGKGGLNRLLDDKIDLSSWFGLRAILLFVFVGVIAVWVWKAS